jgi:hypothetical protein
MDSHLYTNLKNRSKGPLKTRSFKDPNLTLKDLVKIDGKPTGEEVENAFCNDLREILSLEDPSQIIDGILGLESDLKNMNSETLYLNVFYKNFSDLVLRMLKGDLTILMGEKNDTKTIDAFKEGMRIALEEELYTQQDKILS